MQSEFASPRPISPGTLSSAITFLCLFECQNVGSAPARRKSTGWRCMTFLLLFVVAFLAFSNGANDNFKGVASLFGSRTATYRTALGWATISTFAGAVCSVLLAETL